ncbi:MAG: hypothetical protein BGO12_10785 [Verrucomicrobia bacterium 61-8]|nr:MAG: hypothetical protein BGO12_10785 [Verrucomicrobia bacterium 61-8]
MRQRIRNLCSLKQQIFFDTRAGCRIACIAGNGFGAHWPAIVGNIFKQTKFTKGFVHQLVIDDFSNQIVVMIPLDAI